LKPEWRLLGAIDADGFLQMAIDHVLLEAVAAGESPATIRCYRFAPPCLSIGRFQPLAHVDLKACEELGIDVVRRPTGGRAILHMDDFTYMVALPATPELPDSVEKSYEVICRGIIAGLRRFGIEAELVKRPRKAGNDDMACFSIPASADLALKGRKLCGSAQVRSKGGVLQHGSMLLRKNTDILFKLLPPEPGKEKIKRKDYEESCISLEEMGLKARWEDLEKAFIFGFSEVFGVRMVPGGLSDEEMRRTERLVEIYARKEGSHGHGRLTFPWACDRICGKSEGRTSMDEERDSTEIFIDFKEMDDEQLKEILNSLLKEEREVSYRRRLLHGKIDMLRAELVRRKKKKLDEGGSLFTEEDIEKLSAILAGRIDKQVEEDDM